MSSERERERECVCVCVCVCVWESNELSNWLFSEAKWMFCVAAGGGRKAEVAVNNKQQKG